MIAGQGGLKGEQAAGYESPRVSWLGGCYCALAEKGMDGNCLLAVKIQSVSPTVVRDGEDWMLAKVVEQRGSR